MSGPKTFADKIAEAVHDYEMRRRVVVPGRIDVGLALYGILRDEARAANRLHHHDASLDQLAPLTLSGWRVVGDHEKGPLEWAIVPA